jgi:prolyl oligopeptidase
MLARRVVLSACLVLNVSAALPAASEPPATPRRPVVNEYHGVKVTDDYQWLEDWSNPEVRAWSEAQNAHARAVLDHLPGVAELRARIKELVEAEEVRYTDLAGRNDLVFALKHQPPRQQPMLVVMTGVSKPGEARTVLDPNALDATGGTAIDWYVPSHDGRLVAVSMSKGGSEAGDVTVYETFTGRQVGEVVPRVNGGTAGGGLAWAGDGSGFFYTRYPRGEERPPEDRDFYVQVYFHALGTPTGQDRYEIGREFPRIAEINLQTTRNGRFALASVQDGDGGEFSHFLRTPDGAWTRLTGFKDKVVHGSLAENGTVFMVSRDGAPRGKVIAIAPGQTLRTAATVVPEDRAGSIETNFAAQAGLVVTPRRIYIIDQVGGPNRVRVFDHTGQAQVAPVIPPVSSVEAIVPTGPKDDALVLVESYLQPPAWWEFRAVSGDFVRTPLATSSPADFSDCEVIRETATSRDGTKVPMTIIARAGTPRNGDNPTILWGYGGYGVSISPVFRPVRRVWLERGGVYAIAHLRGGGELGDDWHRQGNLTRKQNVFDDFHACAQRLFELGLTSSRRLAIMGGSNGGLLMGATFTQHPDLARVVVADVGIYDMLRVELSPNGAFNVTEFGTVTDPEQFRALHAYSPYHHVADGARYPAILMLTGANDPRVDPMHSRKMVARLQAATGSGRPVLLRTSMTSGHGIGSSLSERVEQDVDRYAFLMHELGVPVSPPPAAPSADAAEGGGGR